MKNFTKLFFLLMVPAIAVAQDKSIKASSTIKTVTVFLTGAQVERDASVSISAGVSEVVFSGLSNDINQQSIQVKGEGNFTILSVNKQSNYLKEQSKTDEVQELSDKVDAQNEIIAKLDDELTINKTQQEILAKNQETYTGTSGFDINKLKSLLDFQKAKLKELKDQQYVINAKKKIEDKKLSSLNNQLSTLINNSAKNTSDIVVKLSSPSALKANFKITYLVNSAFWYPTYDIRARDITDPIKLAYKANVSQGTGEDWGKINLILSSGNPSDNNNILTLYPYNLEPSLPQVFASRVNEQEVASIGYDSPNKKGVTGNITSNQIMVRGIGTNSLQVNAQQAQTSLLFNIKEIYTIPSDGKLITVEIGNYDIPASFSYTAIPKLSNKVNLTAKITDFNNYNLLTGQANIFFDGTYLGSSQLNMQQSKDTLDISLGNDKNVIITREKQKDFKEKQFLGSSQKVTRDFLITIKNRKNKAIDLVVEDQLPVSNNEAIVVEKLDISGAELNETEGKLTWKLNLKPNEEKKLNLKYQVKYPKNININLE